MSRPPDYPALRRDLDIIAQAAPGRPGRHLVRDPQSDRVFEFTAEDIFLARQLDGRTPPETVRQRFRERFGHDLAAGHLNAFVLQLYASGLLTDPPPESPAGRLQSMKTIPLNADRLFRGLAAAFRWAYTWPAVLAAVVLSLVGLRLITEHADAIWHRLSRLFFNLEYAGYSGAFTWGDLFQIGLFIVVLPFFRELAKGTTCRHYGYRVPALHYTWYLRFIPRVIADITGLGRAPLGRQLRIASSGLVFEWLVVAAGTVMAEILRPANPLHDGFQHLAVAAAIRFLLNANPFGKLDGCLVVTIVLKIPRLRERAVRAFRDWILLRPVPEPLSPGRCAGFIAYGFLADATALAIDIAIMGLLGYLLICHLEGTGAVLFLLFVALKYEDSLRKGLMSIAPSWAVQGWKRYAGWIWLGLFLILAAVLVLVPYTFKAVGEFRVQPHLKREIRAPVGALIEAIPVREGARVSEGDVLVQLSRRAIEKELNLQRASLKREEARLRELEAGATPEEIERARQKVALAETSLAHSEKALKRTAALYEQQHVSEEDYDKALRQRDMDRENLELAQADLALVLAGERAEKIEAQRAEVERLQVMVRHLEEDLASTTLHAPIDGFVATLYIKGRIGERAEEGEVLAIVENTRVVRLRIAVPEGQASDLEPGAAVRARAWALPDRVFEGSVQAVMPVVIERKDDLIQEARVDQDGNVFRNLDTPPEHVVTVLVEIDNDDGQLKPDMTGFAKIVLRRTSLGYALLHPVIDFFRVRVWSWLP
ncbi:MAG: efflux RND transporter periplasmic adaptor subunit [Lentisphaerae bacterium]|nr:efflux RND transporter periplasmic adaptor subunit [Lentisphaerota bacterium]